MSTQTTVINRPDIDEQTRDELQPPCDVEWAHYLMGICVSPPTKCENPADWIVRRTCHCGAARSNLMCDEHLHDQELLFRCHACDCVDQFVAHHTEPLR